MDKAISQVLSRIRDQPASAKKLRRGKRGICTSCQAPKGQSHTSNCILYPIIQANHAQLADMRRSKAEDIEARNRIDHREMQQLHKAWKS